MAKKLPPPRRPRIALDLSDECNYGNCDARHKQPNDARRVRHDVERPQFGGTGLRINHLRRT